MSNNTAPVLKRRTSNVKGFWDYSKGPIYFTPRTVRVFDGKKFDKSKPVYLIIGEMLGDAIGKDKGGNEVKLSKGDTVGVWGKPGMRDIIQCKGVPTLVKFDGEIDVGKGQPMKAFDVRSADGGTALLVEQDARVFSSHADLMFDVSPHCRIIRPKIDDGSRRAAPNAGYTPDPDTDDDGSDYPDDDSDGIPVDENGKPIF